jgi:hypothetical protein
MARADGWLGLLTFQSRRLESIEAVERVFPSGLNVIATTLLAWPSKEAPTPLGRLGSSTLHSRTL